MSATEDYTVDVDVVVDDIDNDDIDNDDATSNKIGIKVNVEVSGSWETSALLRAPRSPLKKTTRTTKTWTKRRSTHTWTRKNTKKVKQNNSDDDDVGLETVGDAGAPSAATSTEEAPLVAESTSTEEAPLVAESTSTEEAQGHDDCFWLDLWSRLLFL